jgi:hypothetical protein
MLDFFDPLIPSFLHPFTPRRDRGAVTVPRPIGREARASDYFVFTQGIKDPQERALERFRALTQEQVERPPAFSPRGPIDDGPARTNDPPGTFRLEGLVAPWSKASSPCEGAGGLPCVLVRGSFRPGRCTLTCRHNLRLEGEVQVSYWPTDRGICFLSDPLPETSLGCFLRETVASGAASGVSPCMDPKREDWRWVFAPWGRYMEIFAGTLRHISLCDKVHLPSFPETYVRLAA